MKDYKLNEVFYSLQGEGAQVGTPTIFVRFAGCPLKCWFCDTDKTTQMTWSLSQIVKRIEELTPPEGKPRVCLTGGEPLMQPIVPLVEKLVEQGYQVSVETSGFVHLGPLSRVQSVWITCSPKVYIPPDQWRTFNELKFLVGDGHDYWVKVIDAWEGGELTRVPLPELFLQPVWGEKYALNLRKAIGVVKAYPSLFRLSLQMHKYIGVR